MNHESAAPSGPALEKPDMRKRSVDFFRGLKIVLSMGGVLIAWSVLWFVGGKELPLIAVGFLPLFIPLVGALVFDVVEHFWCKFQKVGGPGAWSDPEMMMLGVLIPAMGSGFIAACWGSIGLTFDAATALTQISLILVMILAGRVTLSQVVHPAAKPNLFSRAGLFIFNGIGIATAGFYALVHILVVYLLIKNAVSLFEPLQSPPSLLLIVTIISPLVAVLSLLKLNFRLMNTQKSNLNQANICTGLGAALGIFLIFGPTLPHTFNRRVAYEVVMGNDYSAMYGSSADKQSDAEKFRREGVQKLRTWAIPQLLLEDCYGPSAEVGEFLLTVMLGQTTPKSVSTSHMAEVYYRVYGKSVSDMPIPWRFVPSLWLQDMMRGEQSVGTKVPGLHLAESNIEGVAQADAGIAYLEWTMTFSNTGTQQREARLQLELPPQATVSRAVLWVRDQPRDAAFTERGLATRTYRSIVAERKDPLLVTSAGPGRVLVQCFPVPEHGKMKLMIGMSIPLIDSGDNNRRLSFPAIVESNCADCCSHSIAVRSDSRLTKVRLNDEALLKAGAGLQLSTTGQDINFFEHDFKDKAKILVEKHSNQTKTKVTHATIVLDCSASVAPYKDEIAETIARIGGIMPVDLLLASDQTTPCSDGQTIPCNAKAKEVVQQTVFAGGPPNFDALEKAWENETKDHNGAIVWIHGTQPSPPSFSHPRGRSAQTDSQLDERPFSWLSNSNSSSTTPVFVDVEVEHGINRVSESLDPAVYQQAPELVLLPRSTSIANDIRGCIKALSAGTYSSEWTIERTDIAPQHGVEIKQQGLDTCLTKLWAHSKTLELLKEFKAKEATELASKYQIITPVSAAVVLEFRSQYSNAGIAPPDPVSTTPSLKAADGITSQLNSLNNESPKSAAATGGGGDAFDTGSLRQAEGSPSGSSSGYATETTPSPTAAPSLFGSSRDANLFGGESSGSSEKSRADNNQQLLYCLGGIGVVGAVIVAALLLKRRKPEAKKEHE